MNEPLITITYKEYLKLKNQQLNTRVETLTEIEKIILNNPVDSIKDVLQVIKMIRNNCLNILDKSEGSDNNDTK